MTVKEATIEDLPEMAILWRMMVKEIGGHSKMRKDWWIKYQEKMMNTDIYQAYVAFCDDVMVGFIVGMLYPDATSGKMVAFGQEVYIVPGFRNKRLSSLLYGKLVRLGKKRGAEVIEMACFGGQLEMWENKGYNVHNYTIRRAI